MKVSEDFILQEFVDPETYKRFGDKSIWFIDPKIIDIAQLIRNLTHKPVTINNWEWGGVYKESGLRSLTTTTGAKYSQHKYGRAIDIKVEGMSVQEVYNIIMQNIEIFRAVGLTTIEDIDKTPTWLHLDVRFNNNELQIVE